MSKCRLSDRSTSNYQPFCPLTVFAFTFNHFESKWKHHISKPINVLHYTFTTIHFNSHNVSLHSTIMFDKCKLYERIRFFKRRLVIHHFQVVIASFVILCHWNISLCHSAFYVDTNEIVMSLFWNSTHGAMYILNAWYLIKYIRYLMFAWLFCRSPVRSFVWFHCEYRCGLYE